MTPSPLVTVTGRLTAGYRLLEPNSILHVDELVDELTDEQQIERLIEERKRWCDGRLYTADGVIYSLRNNFPTLSLTRRDVNPVLTRINEADEFLNAGVNEFRPTPEELDSILRSDSTVHINLTKLRLLRTIDRKWCRLALPSMNSESCYLMLG